MRLWIATLAAALVLIGMRPLAAQPTAAKQAPAQQAPAHRAAAAKTATAQAAAASAPDQRRSGLETMSPSIRAMQLDELQNPGMLWVAEGEALWSKADGKRSCASCHGDATQTMKGVAARYPDWDRRAQRPVNLAMRVNLCRTRHQLAPPLPPENDELLALLSYVTYQSRGMPLAPSQAPQLAAPRARGQLQFDRRIGQLNLSCAQCHDQLAGKKLAGATIPEGHANGYPTYRLEWQGMGTLQRRLRNCLNGVRAESLPFDAPRLLELELYLAQRSAGMSIESPAVRP